MVSCNNCDHAHMSADEYGNTIWICDILEKSVDPDSYCDDWTLVYGKVEID